MDQIEIERKALEEKRKRLIHDTGAELPHITPALCYADSPDILEKYYRSNLCDARWGEFKEILQQSLTLKKRREEVDHKEVHRAATRRFEEDKQPRRERRDRSRSRDRQDRSRSRAEQRWTEMPPETFEEGWGGTPPPFLTDGYADGGDLRRVNTAPNQHGDDGDGAPAEPVKKLRFDERTFRGGKYDRGRRQELDPEELRFLPRPPPRDGWEEPRYRPRNRARSESESGSRRSGHRRGHDRHDRHDRYRREHSPHRRSRNPRESDAGDRDDDSVYRKRQSKTDMVAGVVEELLGGLFNIKLGDSSSRKR